LTPALVVVLSLVLLHKTDATMVAVAKCNHKNALVLPFTHALVVVVCRWYGDSRSTRHSR